MGSGHPALKIYKNPPFKEIVMMHGRKISLWSHWVWLFASLLAWALVACGGGGGSAGAPPQPSNVFTAQLSGDQEVPPTTTGAVGIGTLTLASPSFAISGGIAINGVTATAAHIHQANAGANGGVIVSLTESPAGSGQWNVPTGTVLTSTQTAALLAGGLYFNAHSATNVSGDLRGQIGRQVFAVPMVSAQEVPSNASSAAGTGLLVLDPLSRQLVATVTVTGMTATGTHIHSAAVGANGPVIFPLTETPAGSGGWATAAGATMTDAQIATLNSGGLYFNSHSSAFPSGQVRGQIGRNVRYASLTGAQEVPPVTPPTAPPTTATGTGTLVLDPVTRAASGGIAITGMTATRAHIHIAAAGVNGPVIVTLEGGIGGLWNVPAGTVLTADQFRAFKQGGLYFNAHSVDFPDGEIRGQIL
jgi:CHRD domain